MFYDEYKNDIMKRVYIMEKVNATAKRQINILINDNNIFGITKLDNKKLIGGKNE